ncbi:hypothetical protein COB57_05625 [Candidatus Peregrinibacteria bacterium]|nr:MAG: hypothetical protein COB57_05625 [Candidatus Peregrinibacteria bacterium]
MSMPRVMFVFTILFIWNTEYLFKPNIKELFSYQNGLNRLKVFYKYYGKVFLTFYLVLLTNSAIQTNYEQSFPAPEIKIISSANIETSDTEYILQLTGNNIDEIYVNKKPAELGSDSTYVSRLALDHPTTNIVVQAKNKYKEITKEFIVNRQATEEEKVLISEQKKKEDEKQRIYEEVLKEAAKRKKIKEENEMRQEKIKKNFSPWDGSHIKLTKRIIESMNDPDSYEHVRTSFRDAGEHLIVTTVFRGRNGFGGMILNTVKAKMSLEGDILEIFE